jgi:hypothetical protein
VSHVQLLYVGGCAKYTYMDRLVTVKWDCYDMRTKARLMGAAWEESKHTTNLGKDVAGLQSPGGKAQIAPIHTKGTKSQNQESANLQSPGGSA